MRLFLRRIIWTTKLILQLKDFEIKSTTIFQFFEIDREIFFSSLKTRESSLRTLQIVFAQKYLPDQIANRYDGTTIPIDLVSSCFFL